MRHLAGVAARIALAGACGGGATSQSCPAPGVGVNIESLPREWVSRGRFTLCRDAYCSTQAIPFTPFYGRGPFLRGSIDGTKPVFVTLRVTVGGDQVVNARTARRVKPSPAERGEVSETCGAVVRLELGKDRTTLEPSA
jgi:hypothetical protein